MIGKIKLKNVRRIGGKLMKNDVKTKTKIF